MIVLKYGVDFRHVSAPLMQHNNYSKSGLKAQVLSAVIAKNARSRDGRC